MKLPVSHAAYEAVTGERDRLCALLAHATARVDRLTDALVEALRPAPAPQAPVAPDFKDFPPVVAGALAIATAGLPKDVARATYARTRAMLDEGGSEADVAAAVRRGHRLPDVTVERDD